MKDRTAHRFAACLIAVALFAQHRPATPAADLAPSLSNPPGAQEWSLGNDQLALQFKRTGNQVVAHRLVNKLSGRTIPFTADDFSLGIEGQPPLRMADFAFSTATEQAISGGRQLTLHLTGSLPSVRLDVVYELGDHDFFLRRRLELFPGNRLALREVDMWRVRFEGECAFQERGVPIYLQLGPEWKYAAKHQGFGFPVFLEDTFWGLEYPAGYDHFGQGTLTLRHYPGRTITDKFVSKTAVLGAAEPGQVQGRFRRYLDSVIGQRRSPPLFFAWKTWVTLNAPNEPNCLALIGDFQRHLNDRTGAKLDSFALDDGWDKKNSLWEIETNLFPRGFDPLLAALKPMKTGLGLWISPCSGYAHADWLVANRGYRKNAWDWLLCMSDPNYRRDMVNSVVDLVKRYDVNYVKFDAFCAPCDSVGHSHHLLDNFAKEANTDAYLELLAAVRRTQPGIFINITTGTWLSPWWLQHVDSVWDQVFDGWSPAIAPTPERSYSQITDRDAVFRKRCRENPWFPIEALENLGIWTQNYNFIDEQIMTIVARGCRLVSLYVPIPQGQNADRDWRFLGSAINWARQNENILLNTRMILGDPVQLDPYGYAHFLGERGILVLRNPFVVPRTVKIKLDESVGWTLGETEQKRASPLLARIVYPYHRSLPSLLYYGDELAVELSAYEMVVVEVAPTEKSRPTLLGVRCQEAEGAGNFVSYIIHGQPGEKLVVPVVGATPSGEVRWNGRPVTPTVTPQGFELSLTLDGIPQTCQAEAGKLVARVIDQNRTITGTCVVIVPEGSRASMQLLWARADALHPPSAKFSDTASGFRLIDDAAEKAVLRQQSEKLRAAKPRCTATVSGKPVKVTMNDSKLYRPENVGDHRMYAEYSPAPWAWFTFDLPAGRSEVAVAIEWPIGQGREDQPMIGWWLWAEEPLQQGTLTWACANATVAPDGPFPLPVRQDRQRKIQTLQPLTAFPLDVK